MENGPYAQEWESSSRAGERWMLGVRVLGMHRSGTSLVASTFARSGYFVGSPEAVVAPWADNPRGFFERRDVVATNDQILEALGGSWWCPPTLERVALARSRFADLVAQTLANMRSEAGTRPLVLKDPRLCCLLPVWDSVLSDRFVDVLVLRNPMDIARSLAGRNGFPMQLSLALWEIYLCDVLRSRLGHPLLVVNYGLLDRGPGGTWPGEEFEQYLTPLGLSAPDLTPFIAEERHFRSTDLDLLSLGTPSQLRLWRFLTDLAPVVPALSVPDELCEPSSASLNLAQEVGRLIGTAIDLTGEAATREDQRVSGADAPAQSGQDPSEELSKDRLRRRLTEASRARETLRLQLQSAEARVAALLVERAAAEEDDRARAHEAMRVNEALSQEVDRLQSALSELSYQSAYSAAAAALDLESLRRRLNEVGSELGTTVNALRTSQEQCDVLQSALVAETRRVESGLAVLESQRSELTGLAAQVRLLGVVRDEMIMQLEHERTVAAGALARVEELRLELSDVLASRSWRLTRPLRSLFFVLRGRRSREVLTKRA